MRNHGRTIESEWRTQTGIRHFAPTRTIRRASPLAGGLKYLWSLAWMR